ncbi:peptidoglycan-binding protein [Streptomyces sp. NPDC057499]|uniref:peptidoglycan-binding domain-containing protein n=1 Tax=Streptomyces sp. NPDC057499 TaxID=3346150 RepID=UPI0036BAB35B
MPLLRRRPRPRLAGVLLSGALAVSSLALATVASAPAEAATYPCNRTYYSGEALTAYGDTGSRVTEAQCLLVGWGRLKASGVDGQFGPTTRSAVIAFQKGLKSGACGGRVSVDGIVGPVTWYYLRYGCG